LTRIDLETGTAALHAPAVSLYRSAGFIDRGPFADYSPSPHNQFLTLPL
jgi:putative acetyltransferase